MRLEPLHRPSGKDVEDTVQEDSELWISALLLPAYNVIEAWASRDDDRSCLRDLNMVELVRLLLLTRSNHHWRTLQVAFVLLHTVIACSREQGARRRMERSGISRTASEELREASSACCLRIKKGDRSAFGSVASAGTTCMPVRAHAVRARET